LGRQHGQPAPWPELSVANIGGAMFSSLNQRREKKRIKV
jgi:hypothetical protein